MVGSSGEHHAGWSDACTGRDIMFSQVYSREISLPGTEGERYRKMARAAVGLTSADIRRMKSDHAWLRANREGHPLQYARDVLELDDRATLMRKIAAAYAALHARAPEQLLWAGFAAIAVNDGIRPAAELAVQAARMAASVDVGDTVARIAEDGIKCAYESSFAIYLELAWLHHAYLEGGIEVLRWLHTDGMVADEVMDGFEDIVRGLKLGGAGGRALVLQGNLALFRHEQQVVVTPIFEKYAVAVKAACDLGLFRVPNHELATACTALGRDPRWLEGMAGASYVDAEPRWSWLVEHAWKPYVQLQRTGSLETSLQRAAAGRGENGAPATRAVVRILESMLP